jgi:transcriptional regulator with XRE-family HTH domain
MDFREKVLYVRDKLNLSQEQFAKEPVVIPLTISRWKTGKFKPNKRIEYSFELFCRKHKIDFEVK